MPDEEMQYQPYSQPTHYDQQHQPHMLQQLQQQQDMQTQLHFPPSTAGVQAQDAAYSGGDMNVFHNLVPQMVQGFGSMRDGFQGMETEVKRELSSLRTDIQALLNKTQLASKKGWIPSFSLDLVGKGTTENTEDYDLRLAGLENEKSTLEGQVQSLQTSRQVDQNRILDLEEKVRHFNMQQASLKEEKQNLKHMITNANLDKGEPDETKMKNMFANIRQDIQKLVLKLDIRAQPKSKECLPANAVFYTRTWPEVQGNFNATRLRLRTEIYHIIKQEIFEKACFGASGDTELKLANLEHSFAKLGNDQLVAEWRKLSIQCISGLKQRKTFPKMATDIIWDLIIPILPRDKNKDQKTRELLEDICIMAYDLTLQFRQSKSKYQIHSITAGTAVMQTEAEEFTSLGFESPNLGDQDIAGSKVAYTVFGAMIKFDYGYGKQLVLDNAMVVCKK